MGMSTHIRAFIPDTDKDYQRHKNVLWVCKSNKVSLPKETADYFGSTSPEENLLEEKLEIELEEETHYSKYNAPEAEGIEIELDKLPKGVTKIRFINQW
jgi:hypothetical protein